MHSRENVAPEHEPRAARQHSGRLSILAGFVSRRGALWLGFGGLLGLMVAMAVSTDRTMRRLEAGSAGTRQDFLERQKLLHQIRLGLFRTGADILDLVVDQDKGRSGQRRLDLDETWKQIDSASEQYQVKLGGAERRLFDQLRMAFSEYRQTMQLGVAKHGLQGDEFLRREMLPRYRHLLEVSDKVGALNIHDVNSKETEMARVFAAFRRELVAGGMAAICLGLILAIGSIRRILHLERSSSRRFQEVVSARSELRRLSARLVAAQEEERKSLSRELHDEVGQAMTAISVELGNIDSSLSTCGHEVRSRLLSVKRLAESTVSVIRNMALLLRPSMLDDLGLLPALRWQAREMTRRTGIVVKVAAEAMFGELPDLHRTCIYRVVQEALNNAARHSGARQVRVTVAQEGQLIRFSIQDDGIGFNPAQERGVGLVGMEERIHGLGGLLLVQSEPHSGTVISVRLPLTGLGLHGTADA